MDGVGLPKFSQFDEVDLVEVVFPSGFLFNRHFVSDVCVFHLLSLKNLWENDQNLATTHKFNIL